MTIRKNTPKTIYVRRIITLHFSYIANIRLTKCCIMQKMLNDDKNACFGRDSSHLTYLQIDKALIIIRMHLN